jgi:hypothetical protein
MQSISADPEANAAWRGLGRALARVRDWPADGNSRYSPVFCISLLLGVALIIEIGR